MFGTLRHPRNAGALVTVCLVASTSAFTQQSARSFVVPQASVVTLQSEVKPEGTSLARKTSDARFENAPSNYHIFTASGVEESSRAEVLTLNFSAETTLKSLKLTNKNFVIERGGSCSEGTHYARGASCSLMVRFTPQGPGHKLAFLKVENSAEVTPAYVGLAGNGYAPVLNFTPALITTVPSTVRSGTGALKGAMNMAVDGGDTIYIPDTGNNLIKEIDSSGTISTLTPFFAVPASLVADSAGFLYSTNTAASTYYFSYYTPWGSQTAYGYTHVVGTCTPSTPCPIASVGLSQPANINIDPYDNLFMEDSTKGAVEMPVQSLSGGSGALNLWYLTNQYVYSSGTPASFAVDAADNLYNFYTYSTACFLQRESLYQAEYAPTATRVAGGTACGFSGDGGQARSARISSKVGQIAFDVAGNLYFADSGNQRIRRIEASTGIISTIAGTGTAGYSGDNGAATTAAISSPTGVAVDSQGQVYILSNAPTAGPTQAVRQVGTSGYWKMTQVKGTTSAAKVFTVANNGNLALTLSAAPFFSGTNASEFAIDPTTTSCVLTAGSTLAAGRSCKVGITFKPAALGARSAKLVFQSNTISGTNIIQLAGQGVSAPTMTITSPASGATVAHGTTVNFSVSVTSGTTPKPTGTVTFKVNGTALGNAVTLSATGAASKTFSEATGGTYALSATYNGDSNYAATTVSENLVVSSAITVTVGTPQTPATRQTSTTQQ